MSEIPDWDWMDSLPKEEQQRIAALIKGQESYRKVAPEGKPTESIKKPENSD